MSSKKDKHPTPRDYPPDGFIRTNFDYEEGESPYHGKPGDGEKSMEDWIKKRRKKNKNKKAEPNTPMCKLAKIRSNDSEGCPFGLKIPMGCKSAGEIITKMAPLSMLGDEVDEESKGKLIKANKHLFVLYADGDRCAYAGKLFKEKEAVECNWGTNAPGVSQDSALLGSPYYSKVYNNVAYDGLFSYPQGWYGDENISRNLYYGAYSLQGSDQKANLEKIASTNNDIKDAINHAIMQEDYTFTGTACYDVVGQDNFSISEIMNWDDYSSWGEWDEGELRDQSNEEMYEEVSSFRGSAWADRAFNWLKIGFPPIILVETLDAGMFVGDGRGRLSFANGLGIKELPVMLLKESKTGSICAEIKDGFVKRIYSNNAELKEEA